MDWQTLLGKPGDSHDTTFADTWFNRITDTLLNGASLVVAGTHERLTPPPKSLAVPHSRHPDEVRIVAPAGAVLVLNGHVWHSGTRNLSSGQRRVLQCSFVARELARLGEPIIAVTERLSPAARYLLGA